MSTLFAGLVACMMSLCFTPLIIFAAKRWGWFDEVNDRKIHTGQIARLGGIAIFWSFAMALIGSALILGGQGLPSASIWLVAAAMLMVHLVGLADDFKDLKARIKFVFHLAAAILIVVSGYRFKSIYFPFLGDLQLAWLSYPISVIWIVGLINAVPEGHYVPGASNHRIILSFLMKKPILIHR